MKGYRKFGNSPMLGKGKSPLDKSKNLWKEYLVLWKTCAKENPILIEELKNKVKAYNNVLSDRFANTPVNQAHALADILNDL